MAEVAGKEKPSVLIIGGLGYIGRFLALHIHHSNLASEVRLVDKVLPQLAWLAPEFSEACSQDKFIQADASRERESLLSSRHCSHGLIHGLQQALLLGSACLNANDCCRLWVRLLNYMDS
jgi:nucleoside-diphosphate-sugar epimerase